MNNKLYNALHYCILHYKEVPRVYKECFSELWESLNDFAIGFVGIIWNILHLFLIPFAPLVISIIHWKHFRTDIKYKEAK